MTWGTSYRSRSFYYNLFFISLIVVLIALWSLFVWSVGVDTILDVVGVQNGYIIVGLIALIGGFSTLTSTSLYVAVGTFSLAGLDPFLMGLIGGFGVSVGDSMFYYLGTRGREVLTHKYEKTVQKLSKWIKKRSETALITFIYIYCATPFMPIDLLTVSLATLRVRYWKVIIPVFFGNMTLIAAVGILVHRGISLF